MKKTSLLGLFLVLYTCAFGQKMFTPKDLWTVGRVSALGISTDQKFLIYNVKTPSIDENNMKEQLFKVPLDGGEAVAIDKAEELLANSKVSPNGHYVLYSEPVKLKKIAGNDYYEGLSKSNVQIYESLDYRHWDTYADGKYNHVFFKENKPNALGKDIMEGEPFHSPTQPFGGDEDFIWSPDGSKIIYVSKKLEGTAAANSTNTDLYAYDLTTGLTTNLTAHNKGYDTQPAFSIHGDLAWLQMKTEGYEADKNDIVVRTKDLTINLTGAWDGTVESFKWSKDGKKIYFIAPVKGTLQLFEVNFPGLTRIAIQVRQLTDGDFDVTDIVDIVGDKVIVGRTDFNTATEIYAYDLKNKNWKALTHVNDAFYAQFSKSKFEKRWVPTSDGKQMLVWVIFPPEFDENKKYPALLFLQGGPQAAVSQFYSFRWNFQLMAAQGYIVVAPNRRGMPGHGVKWNEEISKDWGGQSMRDYLAAIDAVAKEKYVDNKRLGAVGASYGGYSAYYLAGIHENRFKTFIAHAGVFNLESMYGTTEEMFFVNWDLGGPYWEKSNKAAQKTYAQFNPIKNVDKWNTPMLVIHGGKDYRVPIGQGQEAFQVLQQKGIKSRFVYFPDENHWVLQPQNALIWQGEFFRWLKETL